MSQHYTHTSGHVSCPPHFATADIRSIEGVSRASHSPVAAVVQKAPGTLRIPDREAPSRNNDAVTLHPGKLWGLADMLDHWGYKFLSIGTALGYIEVDLQRHRVETSGGLAGLDSSTLDANHPVAKFVLAKCEEILKLNDDDDFAPVSHNVRLLVVRFLVARGNALAPLRTTDILNDVVRIKNDFLYILSKRSFYYLRSDLEKYYGKPELFGSVIAKRFKEARDDIESAGNCLALGEPTACVLHLMRALEAVIHKLARKLRVTINPRDTWGAILNNMDAGIKALPATTGKEQRKKDLWSECRANLFHVKNAWRDPSMHPKRSYDEKQAHQILTAVQVFLDQLATL